MQTAEVRDRLDPAVSSNRSREWGVFTSGQVRAPAVLVIGISLEHAAQVRCVENHKMVQALASDRSDQSLTKGLPALRGATKPEATSLKPQTAEGRAMNLAKYDEVDGHRLQPQEYQAQSLHRPRRVARTVCGLR